MQNLGIPPSGNLLFIVNFKFWTVILIFEI